jgi:hypothetical protein
LLGLVSLLTTSSVFGAEPRREREEPVDYPKAGTVLKQEKAVLLGKATINFSQLAAQEKLRAPQKGPELLRVMPEFEEEEALPDRTTTSSLVRPEPPRLNIASPSPSFTFPGVPDSAQVGGGFTSLIPPDTDGAVGLTMTLEGLNNNYRISNKGTGAEISTVSTNTFWAASGAAVGGFSDPRTEYDPINNRWIVCMLGDFTGPGTFPPGYPNSSIVVGVSQTSDPTGGWYIFRIKADAASQVFADFPLLGFNKNWVVINIATFLNSSGAGSTARTLVIDYPALRAGTFSGSYVIGSGARSAPSMNLSATDNTEYIPNIGFTNGDYRVDTITPGPGAGFTYTVGATLSRGQVGLTQPTGNLLPQSPPNSGVSSCGATPCLVATGDIQIQAAPVTRDGFTYFAVTARTSAAPVHTFILWTKISNTTFATVDGGRIEETTATATNGGKWYSWPHIAVNKLADILIGYSQFSFLTPSGGQHPSAGYSYHDHTDPAGTMRDPVVYKAGEDYYNKTFSSGRNRWGDYSKAQVDPSDDMSLWTLQEYARLRKDTAGNLCTDDAATNNCSRWGTFWANVAGPAPTVSIGPAKVAHPEGNSGTTAYTFTVSLSFAYSLAVTVNYQTSDGSATVANNDYVPATGSVTIPAGLTSATLTVFANGDTKLESDETFNVNLTGATNATLGSPTTATATILNDDGTPSISIADLKVIEGNSGPTLAVFTVTLSNTSDQKVSVDYTTNDGTATTANTDYFTSTGTLSIAPKTSSGQITVLVNGDTKREGDETYTVDLSNPVGATIADGQAIGTISNDDGVPTVSIDDVKVVEGDAGTVDAVFTVSLSNTSDQSVTVDYQTGDGTATLANSDYNAATGTVKIQPKTSSTTLTVQVNGDTKFENNETFFVTLSNPVNATIGDGSGIGTISNDDGMSTLSINDVKVNEADGSATFSVSLSAPSGKPVTVAYSTSDGSATTANNDYVSTSGTLTFADKTETKKTITVPINDDCVVEPNETFTVDLNAAVNATIADGQGVGTISNDDAGVAIHLDSPNGGEHWGVATTQKIAWTASSSCSPPINIDIYFSDNSGGSYSKIASNEANDGTFSWFIPKTYSTSTARIKVVGTDTGNNVSEDASDADFDIFAGSVQAEAASPCISNAHPCVEIPVTLHRPDVQAVRAFTVTIQLSPELTLCAPQFADGDFLQNAPGAPVISPLQVTNNGGGSYTVDQALLGSVPLACGGTAGAVATDAVLFKVYVTNTVPNGTGSISIVSGPPLIGPFLRKCDNTPEPVGPGGPLSITIDTSAPGPVTGLTATQQKIGNDNDGTTKIALTFTPPGGASIEVWRAGFGQYPEYDDAGGAVPATPGSYPPPAPWALTTVTASGQSDEVAWPNRDFYYYVAYAKDACGNASIVSNKTNGTLNYHLGDWHNGTGGGDCVGDNLDNTADLSFLGAHYGITLSHSSDPYACLDVGPTTDNTVNGRPTTDDRVQFEDLVLWSINYFSVSLAPGALPEAKASLLDEVKLEVPASLPGVGQTFKVGVNMSGAGDIQALSVMLDYNRAIVEPVGVGQGELLARQASRGIVLSSEPGNVDLALLGIANGGILGNGRVAEMTFRVKASGDAGIVMKHLDARDSENQRVQLGVTHAPPTIVAGKTMLGVVSPNPFNQSTSVEMSLASGGMVKLAVYDVQGRQMKNLVDGYQLAGRRIVNWDGRNDAGMSLAAGVYVIRMEAGGAVMSRRVAVVR